MTNAPMYLINNVDRIRNIEQQAFSWSKAYNVQENHTYSEHGRQAMAELQIQFKGSLKRDKVIDLFRFPETYYLGFLASNVWGGISVQNGHFRSALTYKKEIIENIIKSINDAFATNSKEEIRTIYLSLYGGKNHIKGIGPSYFTKLFFFVGQANDEIMLKPLILDKWTQNAFFALLSQIEEYDLLRQFFNQKVNLNHSKRLNRNICTVSLRGNVDNKSEAYWKFINLLNEWAKILDVPVSKIEEFVFGTALNIDRNIDNPRIELSEIIYRYKFPNNTF
jgi:hypothetical protein